MDSPDVCVVASELPPKFTGAGKRALRHCQYLASRDIQVTLLTSTASESDVPNLRLSVVDVPKWAATQGRRLNRMVYVPTLFLRIWNALSCVSAPVVHVIGPSSLFATFAALAAKYGGKKLIVETTLVGSDDPISVRRKALGRLRSQVFVGADAVVNISPALRDKCREAGLSEDILHIIPNSVDTHHFAPATLDEKRDIKAKLGISRFDSICLYVGALIERKRVHDLIYVFSEVAKRDHRAGLVLAGPAGPNEEGRGYYEYLRGLIREAGIEDRTLLPGRIANVAEWMKASDIFVFPSRSEGFGTVQVEAMSVGLPVVATKIPGVTEYIIDGKNGVAAESVQEMTSAVVRLLVDDGFRNQVSKSARRTALQVFSDDVIMPRYLELYRNLS